MKKLLFLALLLGLSTQYSLKASEKDEIKASLNESEPETTLSREEYESEKYKIREEIAKKKREIKDLQNQLDRSQVYASLPRGYHQMYELGRDSTQHPKEYTPSNK